MALLNFYNFVKKNPRRLNDKTHDPKQGGIPSQLVRRHISVVGADSLFIKTFEVIFKTLSTFCK